MVTGVVVAAAAAATAMLQPAAVVAVDLQRTHGTGIEGVGGCPLSPHISPSDPATDASALASLAVDAPGAAIPSVDGAASVVASDGTVPADDSRTPTAPPTDAAEVAIAALMLSFADKTVNAPG